MDNEMANNFRDWERYIRISRRFTATEVAMQADHDASWLIRWEKLPQATILEPWQYLKIRDYIAPGVPMRSLVKTAPMKLPFLSRKQRKEAAEILERARIAKCVANFTLSTKIGLSANSWAYLLSTGGAPAESTVYQACKVLGLDYKNLLKEVGVNEPEECNGAAAEEHTENEV